MASPMIDDDSALQTSLLDIIEERNRGKEGILGKSLVHRLVYIARLKDGIEDRTAVGNYYEELLTVSHKRHQMEPATGLLLLFPKHLVHIVESSTETLLDVVRDVVKGVESGEGYVTRAKILIVAHDVQARLSAQWSFRTLDIQVANVEAYDPSESNEQLIVDMLVQTLKLGIYLSRQPKPGSAPGEEMSLKTAMDSLHEKVPELLPQQAVVEYLLNADDPHLILPEVFLAKYSKTFDVTLHSELTWPMPIHLFPYTY